MKYYLIVGEASGDLHASNLMKALKEKDSEAEFRFFGGDLMLAVGGTRVKHYKELAYMGFIPVLMHLRTIFKNMDVCEQDILLWQPDVLILVDYPGFNLDVARYIKKHSSIPVYYYISPKIWAWKEWRIKRIKRDIDEMFSILPFEIDFYKKHNYPIHYIGNPCVDAIDTFKAHHLETFDSFIKENGLTDKPIIALLAGSRKQEIKDNLPVMIEAASVYTDKYQLVLAGAPSIEDSYYSQYIKVGVRLKIVHNQTYRLLQQSKAALVTSGTATLETCLFHVPQVVCYYTPLGKIIAFLKRHVLSVQFISLVNLIANKEVVKELVADKMTVGNIRSELCTILNDKNYRQNMLNEYDNIIRILGEPGASRKAAQQMVALLRK
ncbi:lipid-A-disaccharide synthase [Phocaeicola oris]|uniref:lipid-A-disaccharide synthase n=1 Tax=Phocaeicola oris TaxID=2896850 RepID=UPI00234F83A9|nr:lipid-A-disaccharide synthase [Phocaeicola oris]MCE2616805.1 lipid-A-disaccharide synthase [Phocaeicola oris]